MLRGPARSDPMSLPSGNTAHRLATPVQGGRDHCLGSDAADLTRVEYGSFDCPYCQEAHEVVANLRDRFAGRPKSGRYREGGIYRYNFDVAECRAEVAAHFNAVTARPARVYLPLSRTLRLPVERLSRLAERVPLVNRLGELVLCTAADPVEASRGT